MLELSIFDHGQSTTDALHTMLARLEKEERIKVNLNVIPWQGGWARMVNIALYGEGADLSEVGSTWVGDFVKMDALSPFSGADLRVLGTEKVYLPASWSSGTTQTLDKLTMVWAIPWMADTRVIYYRRDLLDQAGIDETTAFETPVAFENTLQTLLDKGVRVPLTLPMGRSRQSIHNVAAYVWGAGGTFLSPDGKHITFAQPEALAGMRTYFRLGQFLAPEVRTFGEGASENYFLAGNAAVTISGTWVPTQIVSAEIFEKVGAASIPGVPWVGGSNFVIWKHCAAKREAVRVLQYLTAGPLSQTVYPFVGLPTRLTDLEDPRYLTDPRWRVMRESLLKGRAFPPEQLWGLIESRLTDLLPIIWEQTLADPRTPIETILKQFISPLAHRLSLTLSARQ